MRKILLGLALLASSLLNIYAEDNYTVQLARAFGKDLFEINGINYLKPMVQCVNATSNSRFFNQAYIPTDVEQPYFRIGLHSMVGFVPQDMKTYAPVMPSEKYSTEQTLKFLSFNLPKQSVSINDTAGLLRYFFLTMCDLGLQRNSFDIPKSSATILGSSKLNDMIPLRKDTLHVLIDEHPFFKDPLWNALPAQLRDSMQRSIKNAISPYIDKFPNYYRLPEGGNINTILAGIPQFEIGSFLGTEALIRFIPPVNLGNNIGDFSFWGFGLKHSISQYFPERYFDLAIQGVYQGTHLTNTVGSMNSELIANAAIWNLNIHASKSFEDLFDVYSGISYETININTSFKYALGLEMQWELGLLERYYTHPTPGYPGDQYPQVVSINLNDNNLKWILGISRQFGAFAAFVDFSVSRIYIFSGGIEVRL